MTATLNASTASGQAPCTSQHRGVAHTCLTFRRLWQSMQQCSSCQAVVVLFKNKCIAHLGVGRPGHDPATAVPGVIATRAMSSGKGNYLANLSLYPGDNCKVPHSKPASAKLLPTVSVESCLLGLACNVVQGHSTVCQHALHSMLCDCSDALHRVAYHVQQIRCCTSSHSVWSGHLA